MILSGMKSNWWEIDSCRRLEVLLLCGSTASILGGKLHKLNCFNEVFSMRKMLLVRVARNLRSRQGPKSLKTVPHLSAYSHISCSCGGRKPFSRHLPQTHPRSALTTPNHMHQVHIRFKSRLLHSSLLNQPIQRIGSALLGE